MIPISNPGDHITEQNLTHIKKLFHEKVGFEAASQRNSQQNRTQRYKRRIPKIIYIPIAAILSLTIVTGAAAAMGVIDLSAMLQFLSVDRINILQPVNKTSEDQGIRMQTLGAVRDGSTTEIYVALTDLTGDRVNASLDVYDYHVSGGRAHHAQVVQYDAAEKTAIVRFLVQGKRLSNRMSVQISSFLSGATKEENYDSRLNLSEHLSKKQQYEVDTLDPLKDWISGWGGESAQELSEQEFIHVLRQDQTHIKLPGIDWMYISNIGFVDGKLHIQINPDDEMGGYNHGYFFFTDDRGNKQDIAMNSVSYGSYTKDGTNYGGDYEEYIFDISNISQLEHLQLKGNFTRYDQFVTGKWETTFDLKQDSLSKTGETTLVMNEDIRTEIKVSSLGVTLMGKGMDQFRPEDLHMVLYLNNGTSILPKSGFINIDDNLMKWISPHTIPVNEVNYLMLNGQKVKLQD
ncbi:MULTISPECIES: DUF4179 domain-containing protein [unclassified Paenibacillus]|uniref:DUF4179 domain-containing protein n=1 Tax=unclassified Paenibacillus TaxID=185978 RepID=UPI000405E4A9|nr:MULTISPECIES: DUF4179 domain-containing protein [unclassified Paenibacillus]KGP80305.1 hypothetical protein P364_0119790 [Paenibacillus sp. MAEPY2]KGP81147.1 hypothetical protein P363_0128365 [Paenibacillus sp. MAEPY1]